MTRTSLNHTLRTVYIVLAVVVAIAVAGKLVAELPGWSPAIKSVGKTVYDLLTDMSLLIATGGVAYLTNVFQKRSKFVESLEEEWRGIVKTKSALYAFCDRSDPTADDYIAAYARISETIDNMRIVYRNVGETNGLVGLYPYSPLHDMRRALQWIDPRVRPTVPAADRRLVQDAVLQAFFALRECFLEELDLQEPVNPLLIAGGRRLKTPGSTPEARAEQDAQRARHDAEASYRPDIDALLLDLYREEQARLLGQRSREAAGAATVATASLQRK